MVLFFLKPRNGRPRTQVQHLMQIDLKEGWGVGYLSSFQQYCVRQMLNSVAGLREWFAQSDERNAHPRIPVMVNLSSTAVSSKKNQKPNDFSINPTSLDQMNATSRSSALIDEYFDDEEDFQIAEPEQEAYQIGLENDVRKTALEEEPAHEIDFSSFSGNLRRDDRDNARDCWKISDGNNFKVRSKHYCYEKTKVPAGKHMLDLVAVDWFIDSKRMDHVARRHGCAAQKIGVNSITEITSPSQTRIAQKKTKDRHCNYCRTSRICKFSYPKAPKLNQLLNPLSHCHPSLLSLLLILPSSFPPS
ncbi:hypothetical protein GLYMA_16G092900v4 [Glycine max]|uniref:Protein ENHANCED DISEASE RESISTANCE 2 C-terminal domain-containing protein n=2 Tax=Glycine subgen. Soja TaxID=1462606 RepID=A0A0R0FYK8_SOYBN|nr:hypothetical protein GYH30_044594 [Glycine max]KRH07493.1 hypothetical protein GLYMA_16G092900v4 [Glycine max]RZB60269.1 Protein ENHANCED DISEASE RESISTANCE 2 [Glycine soja]